MLNHIKLNRYKGKGQGKQEYKGEDRERVKKR